MRGRNLSRGVIAACVRASSRTTNGQLQLGGVVRTQPARRGVVLVSNIRSEASRRLAFLSNRRSKP
jgi:hypothetical protein